MTVPSSWRTSRASLPKALGSSSLVHGLSFPAGNPQGSIKNPIGGVCEASCWKIGIAEERTSPSARLRLSDVQDNDEPQITNINRGAIGILMRLADATCLALARPLLSVVRCCSPPERDTLEGSHEDSALWAYNNGLGSSFRASIKKESPGVCRCRFRLQGS